MTSMPGVARWWQRLEPRERRLVAAAGCVSVAALVYLLAWEPAADGIRKLQADLPQLREQNAALVAMRAEAISLRAAAGATTPIAVAERAAAVRRSLERAGVWRAATAGATPIEAGAVQATRTLDVGGAVTTVGTMATASRAAPPEVTAEGDRVRVRFDEVDYGVWAGWLAAAETELAARAVRVSVAGVAPKGPVGHVRAEALFDWTPASASARP